jgi:DNA-binding transcriptional LysR family regulator
LRADGLPHVEVTSSKTPAGVIIADHHPGAQWVVPRMVQLAERWPGMKVAIISGSTSAAESLVPALIEAGIDLIFIKGGDVTAACGLFYRLATTAGLRHRSQLELTSALTTARKAVEDGEGAWRWGRKRSNADITTLYAATLALWAVTQNPAIEPSIFFM